ncbi:MAG TPA: GAF domain-containing protein [Terriglobales bacterium]|nr:GAF domain-containing protein [Terriglobales bacterium]
MALHDTAVPLRRARVEDVLITGELRYRVPKSNSSVAKARTKGRRLKELAAKSPSTHEFLEALARAAREVCNAGAAGVSVLAQSPQGQPIIRWETVAGELAQHAGATSPRDWSPSGATLERRSPQLFLYPARCFHYLDQLKPAIVEGLVVPIFIRGVPWGTLWVVSHEEHRNFDQTDVDAVSSLAEFASRMLGQ